MSKIDFCHLLQDYKWCHLTGLLCHLPVMFVNNNKVKRHEISLMVSTKGVAEVILVNQWCDRDDSA